MALQADAVPDQRECSAVGAGVAFVALESGHSDLFGDFGEAVFRGDGAGGRGGPSSFNPHPWLLRSSIPHRLPRLGECRRGSSICDAGGHVGFFDNVVGDFEQADAVGAVAAHDSFLVMGDVAALIASEGLGGGAERFGVTVKREWVLVAVGAEAFRRVVDGGKARGAFFLVQFGDFFFFVKVRIVLGLADGVVAEVFGLDLDQVISTEVGHRQLAEDVVDDRGGHLDVVVAVDHTVWLESREDERLDELLERNAVLQAQRDRDGEAVHQRPEGSALAVHIDEDLAKRSVFEFAGSEVDLVSAHSRLLGVASTSAGHDSSFADVAVDEFGGDALDLVVLGEVG